MSCKRWTFLQLDKEKAGSLSEECGLDPVLCLLLTGRGITDADEAMEFLAGDELRADPFMFADMDAAVERIQRALDNGEYIMVYGDYDADGITATVLLYSYLRLRGAHVDYTLPHRDGDGYGLHCTTIDRMVQRGVQLIVTVDNGISAVEEIEYAAQCGIDVVVTDHHQPPAELPAAVAVVDPHRRDCPSEFKEFAGVGMAFHLVCALEGDADWALEQYADLVALGTLADVMPLRNDNRLLVRRGLRQIAAGTRPGMQKLQEIAGVTGRPLTASTVAFMLAPRINATGRMGDPEKAVELLLSTGDEESDTLAHEINDMNIQRQSTEAAILQQVIDELEQQPQRLAQRVLVVWGEGWHHGVLGILASRLLECYGKPTLVLSVDGGIARGSGRSIHGFSLYEALSACSDCLLGYGGHEQAAGVTLEAARLEEFSRRLNAYAAETCPTMPIPELVMDCRLRPAQITPELPACLSVMEPFGAGNPAPIFGLFGMRIERIEPVSGGKHLRLTLSRDGSQITAMRFSVQSDTFRFAVGDMVNVAVTLDRNEFRGTVSVSAVIKDIRYADTVQEDLLNGQAVYDAVLRRESRGERPVMPPREALAAVYRYLKLGAFCGTVEALRHSIDDKTQTFAQVYVCLQILCEAQLIEWKHKGNTETITVKAATGKADLTLTDTARYLRGEEG